MTFNPKTDMTTEGPFSDFERRMFRQIIDAATPGPWYDDGRGFVCDSTVKAFTPNTLHGGPYLRPGDCNFAATFDPPTVRRLLDAYEASL